jgi:hypothetical protein
VSRPARAARELTRSALRRLDAWADESRLNPWRLLVMPRPRLDAEASHAFDELLGATPRGGDVAYALPYPKWWFLHHLTARALILHGTNQRSIDEFRPRAGFDAYGAPIDAVFASDDAIWPLYFAVVNRTGSQSYINWCLHVRDEARYVFSIGTDPRSADSWTTGTIYALPRETFRLVPGSRELVSEAPVRPRARLTVEPDDFPFRAATVGHRPGDTPRRVVVRHALRRR